MIYNWIKMWPSLHGKPLGRPPAPVTTLNQELALCHNLQKQIQLHKALAKNVDFTENVMDK